MAGLLLGYCFLLGTICSSDFGQPTNLSQAVPALHVIYGIGFFDVCTKENIIKNIESGRIWCCNSECYDYYNSDFKDAQPWFPCYESGVFSYWSFGSGWTHTGKRSIPVQMNGVQKDKLAIMTTRIPDSNEKQRKIFAIMYIDRLTPSTAKEECRLYFNPYNSIVLRREEWINFWDFYKTKTGDIIWGTGLFRYLSDRQIKKLLQRVLKMKRFKHKSNIVQDLLNHLSSQKVNYQDSEID